jgi:hypothetical protein
MDDGIGRQLAHHELGVVQQGAAVAPLTQRIRQEATRCRRRIELCREPVGDFRPQWMARG